MRLTKKEREEITQVYDTWLNSYLNGDIKTYDSFFDDDYHFIGSTENEQYLDRKETTKFLEDTADQLAGKVEIQNNKRILEKFDGLIFVTELFDSYFLIENEWTYYGKFRFTSALKKTKEGWRFIYQHFSTPDSKAEAGETIGTQKIAAENRMLREAVKRRTTELEQKNRELEIEAALERIRSRSMAMQNSLELSEVSTLLFEELAVFCDEIKGSGIVLCDREVPEQWMCSFDLKMLPPIHIPKDFDEPIHNLYKAWETGQELFYETISGEVLSRHSEALMNLPEIKSIYANVPDIVVEEPQSQTNYAATFKQGYLLIMTENLIESASLFPRFAKVFEQTYTRFLDLQKAEAQARESEIQLALERVRARTMAMHRSEELSDVIKVVSDQLQQLHFKFDNASFVVNSTSEDYDFWFSIPGQNQPHHIHVPFLNNPINSRARDARSQGLKFFADIIDPEDSRAWHQHMFNHNQMDFLSAEAKTIVLQGGFARSVAIMPSIMLVIGNYASKPFDEEENSIIRRFAAVFEQTYTRFLDLQKAEAQAREAQIEAALERVRSRSMGMQKSEELKEVIQVVYEQFIHLKINVDHAGFVVDYKPRGDWHFWIADKQQIPSKITHPYFDSVWANQFDEAKEKGIDFFTTNLNFEEKNKFYQDLFTYIPGLSEQSKEFYFNCPGLAASNVLLENVALYIENFSAIPYTDDENKILMRFGKVFQQTYTRFLDLQKAEAQAREAQIEAALEKVRSRTMAMQRSSELAEVATMLFQQVKALGVPQWTCGFSIFEIDDKEFTWYPGGPEGEILAPCKIPLTEHPVFISFNESRKRGDELYIYEKTGEAQANHYRYMLSLPVVGEYLQSRLDAGEEFPAFQIDHLANFSHGNLIFITYEHFPEMHDIFKRFAKVFEQTYTRFLDLKKAEAQAREAKIEAALEKVRSRTMAMRKSGEIADIAGKIFEELRLLDLVLNRVLIWIFNDEEKYISWWSANPEVENNVESYRIDYNDQPVFQSYLHAWQKRTPIHFYTLSGDTKKKWEDHLFTNTELSKLPMKVRKGMREEGSIFTTSTISDYGLMMAGSFEPLSEENVDIIQRFGRVFQQSYTRFLDVQKAEEQARESMIEAALERVRAKTMAMHHSEELADTASVLFNELKKLGIESIRSGVGIIDYENDTAELWLVTETDGKAERKILGKINAAIHPLYKKWFDAGRSNMPYYVEEMEGEELKNYYETVSRYWQLPIPSEYNHKEVYHGFFFPEGTINVISLKRLSETECNTVLRFAKVFGLLYRRFLDLQKAESQAREAVKQASIDRVRGEIASMRTSIDLERITPLIWAELLNLNVPFIRCGVFIMDEDQRIIHNYLSTPDGRAIAAFHLPYGTPGFVTKVLSHWQKKKMYLEYWDKKAMTEFAHVLVKQGIFSSPDHYLSTLPKKGFHLHLLPFQQGMLYVGNLTQLESEELDLLQSLANAFSTAYARYDDFNKLELAKKQVDRALVDLKQAQQQLVQSEKMASLGELTAGIAHEIQNPLNFVNNFSEVNDELVEELLEEIKKGDLEEVRLIANDIRENEKKIRHHGKRAEGIVKGMLQHSRSSSGQKELTDINVLCDEYLRLAYHGFRAKDKSFNSDFKINLDETLPKINITGQDIGRVILNLINNAFYTVSQKSKENLESYAPEVIVSTRKDGEKVEIRVKDNGSGIPKSSLDKIFQPFFTTKPTGEGTGLGLSISYDIITKGHGGQLEVETKEGEGTEFKIILPIN